MSHCDAKFWARVNKEAPNGCWEWVGPKSAAGYGGVWIGSRPARKRGFTHRMSFEHFNGPIPKGMYVCHRCDNPPCCNPAHLFLGTATDNARDMVAKGRDRPRRGTLSPRAKLTEAEVIEMRAKRVATKISYEALAAQYGVGHSVVERICARKVWRHV